MSRSNLLSKKEYELNELLSNGDFDINLEELNNYNENKVSLQEIGGIEKLGRKLNTDLKKGPKEQNLSEREKR
jgi:hypothetical protein